MVGRRTTQGHFMTTLSYTVLDLDRCLLEFHRSSGEENKSIMNSVATLSPEYDILLQWKHIDSLA